jgi:Zn-dependent protease with chaperone function
MPSTAGREAAVIAAAALSAYAAVLAILGPRWWRTRRWTTTSPRTAVAVLLAGQLSAVLALILAGLCLAVPAAQVSHGVSAALSTCLIRLREAYSAPGGAFTEAAGAGIAAAILAYLFYVSLLVIRTDVRARARHRALVRMLGVPDSRGLYVLDDSRPAIYCVAGGRRACIVATTAALATLSSRELAAALAHERAHLRGRHHWLMTTARVMDRVLAPIGYAPAEPQVNALVEMLADDQASGCCDARLLAEAMVRLAEGPAAALAIGGGADRVARLVAPRSRLSLRIRLGAGSCALVMVFFPVTLAVAPALAAKTAGPVRQISNTSSR